MCFIFPCCHVTLWKIPLQRHLRVSSHCMDEWCQCLLHTQSGEPQVRMRRPRWWARNVSDWTCVVAQEWGGPFTGQLILFNEAERNTQPYRQLHMFPLPSVYIWVFSVTHILTKLSNTKSRSLSPLLSSNKKSLSFTCPKMCLDGLRSVVETLDCMFLEQSVD